MMVSKKKEIVEDDLGQEITDHSSHLRTRNYDKSCYYCIYHGYITDEKKDDS